MAGDYGGMPTRYGAMFGTPARAAETIAYMCGSGVLTCHTLDEGEWGVCPLLDHCDKSETRPADQDGIADWLRGSGHEKGVEP